MLKNIFVLVLCVFILFNFSSCKNVMSKEEKVINIATLRGPTGLGMLKIIDNNETDNNYRISIFNDPSDAATRLINGEVDIATLPTNMASIIYNKTNGYIKIAAVNTLGMLYILSSNDDINSVMDLKNHTVFISGKGTTPECVLKYILSKNNLEIDKDVIIEYKCEHEELASLAIAGKIDVVLLPEPFVTQVINKNSDFKVKISLTDEWGKVVVDNNSLAMGCTAVRKQFIQENPSQFNKFLKEYEDSVEFVNTDIEKAAELSSKYNIMPKEIALSAIPKCNIVFISGREMQNKVNDFLRIIFKFDPKAIGGRIPCEEFYYKQ